MAGPELVADTFVAICALKDIMGGEALGPLLTAVADVNSAISRNVLWSFTAVTGNKHVGDYDFFLRLRSFLLNRRLIGLSCCPWGSAIELHAIRTVIHWSRG